MKFPLISYLLSSPCSCSSFRIEYPLLTCPVPNSWHGGLPLFLLELTFPCFSSLLSLYHMSPVVLCLHVGWLSFQQVWQLLRSRDHVSPVYLCVSSQHGAYCVADIQCMFMEVEEGILYLQGPITLFNWIIDTEWTHFHFLKLFLTKGNELFLALINSTYSLYI